jgi:hypothetical protein
METCQQRKGAESVGGCTLSMDPQEGTGLLPILEDAALSEPHRGTFVTGLVCSIEINEWIRRRQPVRKVSAQLVPCKHVSQRQPLPRDHERLSSLESFTRSLTPLATCCNSPLMVSPPNRKSDDNTDNQNETKMRTVEDGVHFVDSSFNIISEAHYSLTHAVRGPQTLHSRHPTFFLC